MEVGNEDGGRQIGENKVHSVEGDTNGGQRKGDKGREKGERKHMWWEGGTRNRVEWSNIARNQHIGRNEK